jgi:hypothetical protein
MKALQQLDIAAMTPLEAINCLNELQKLLEPDTPEKE